MSQTSYSINQAAALLGMLGDSASKHTESMVCEEAIPVGRGVSKVIGEDGQIRLPATNQGDLVFDADFVADNDIDMKINSVAITTVEWDTDQATTLAALATEIQSNADVVTAEVTALKTITVTGVDGTDIAITEIVVTNGVSQAGGVYTTGTKDTLFGVAHRTQALEGGLPNSDTIPEYPIKSVVNVLRRGNVWVQCETAFNPDTDTLYLRHTVGGATELVGQFRNDSDSGDAVAVAGNVRGRTSLASAGLLLVEINRPV